MKLTLEDAARYANVKAEILQILVESSGVDPVRVLRELLDTLDYSQRTDSPYEGDVVPGKSERILTMLADGPRKFAEIVDAFGAFGDRKEYHRLGSCMHALKTRGLVERAETGEWRLPTRPSLDEPSTVAVAMANEAAS